MTKYFLLRGTSEVKKIYLRIRDGVDVDVRIATDLSISEKKWDKKRTFPKKISGDNSNDQIIESLNKILSSVEEYETGQGAYLEKNTKWLKNAITYQKKKNDESGLLVDRIKSYIDILKNLNTNEDSGVSAGTIKNYRTTISRLERYETAKKIKVYLNGLNFDFYHDYLDFAMNNLELRPNSIGKDIKNIKAVCNDAHDRGIPVNENVFSKRFKPPKEETQFVTLSIDELNRIEKFKGTESLENVRDWLLIGCWTAARADDLLRLTSKNIIEHRGNKVIRYLQSKTGKIVLLAIHPQVQRILDRNNGEFPYRIAYANFNLWIKDVCEAVGLNDLSIGYYREPGSKRKVKGIYPKHLLISTHVCRRSFATNHYHKVPTSKIMAATGHGSERMLLHYISETTEDHIDEFVDVWKSSNQ